MKKRRQQDHKQLIVSVEKLRDLQPQQLATVAGGVCSQSWGKGSTG